jgi:hypothetical protein
LYKIGIFHELKVPFFALEGKFCQRRWLKLQRKILKSSLLNEEEIHQRDALYLDLNLVRIGVKKCQNYQKMSVIMASCEKKSQFWRHCILGSLICLVFYLINIFIFIFQFSDVAALVVSQTIFSINWWKVFRKMQKKFHKIKKNVKMLRNLLQKLNFPSWAEFTLRW